LLQRTPQPQAFFFVYYMRFAKRNRKVQIVTGWMHEYGQKNGSFRSYYDGIMSLCFAANSISPCSVV